MKTAKVNDVKKLLALHFGNRWTENEELLFYKNVIFGNAVEDNVESEDENEGGLMDDAEGF